MSQVNWRDWPKPSGGCKTARGARPKALAQRGALATAASAPGFHMYLDDDGGLLRHQPVVSGGAGPLPDQSTARVLDGTNAGLVCLIAYSTEKAASRHVPFAVGSIQHAAMSRRRPGSKRGRRGGYLANRHGSGAGDGGGDCLRRSSCSPLP
jgi:hypothetical protein